MGWFINACSSAIFLLSIVLSIPIAFDVGGRDSGLAYSLALFVYYFVYSTVRAVTASRKLDTVVPFAVTLSTGSVATLPRSATLVSLSMWFPFVAATDTASASAATLLPATAPKARTRPRLWTTAAPKRLWTRPGRRLVERTTRRPAVRA